MEEITLVNCGVDDHDRITIEVKLGDYLLCTLDNHPEDGLVVEFPGQVVYEELVVRRVGFATLTRALKAAEERLSHWS